MVGTYELCDLLEFLRLPKAKIIAALLKNLGDDQSDSDQSEEEEEEQETPVSNVPVKTKKNKK